jgi:CxxC-x17-CxxC domain-containing protein
LVSENKTIKCGKCGANFTFSSVEQEYFRSKGNIASPEFCPSCRQAKKERSGVGDIRDTDYKYRSLSPMFSATCSRCGKTTEVPFEPAKGKRVYCSECYEQVRASR